MTFILAILAISHADAAPRPKRTFPAPHKPVPLAVLHAECRIACRWGGYHGGVYSVRPDGAACLCVDVKKYDQMTGGRLLVPSRSALRGE